MIFGGLVILGQGKKGGKSKRFGAKSLVYFDHRMSKAIDHAAEAAAFLTKWQTSGAAERANAQLFLAELCAVLGVEGPRPKTPDERANAYVFEKAILTATGSSNFIDLYKRGCFVLETKQGADADESEPVSADGDARRRNLKTGHGTRGTRGYDLAMVRAKEQAERYARTLPKEEVPEGRPPFVLVVDVGHSIALYTDWSRMGGEYVPYPDPASFRIQLKDLVRSEVREMLRTVWTEPLELDPARRSAKVTRDIADRLAKLARSLEGKHKPELVGAFLMRCLFTMFSEDVDLLPHGSFTALLGKLKEDPSTFAPMLENLWDTMNKGGLSPVLFKKLPRFNGGLFADAKAIPLSADQIQLLIEASTANWKDVEPAIFGTLLERALDPHERHKLGAHYTPRAYVERLVLPTVIEPLREEWKSVQVAALQLEREGNVKKAQKEVQDFLRRLATVKVLDPACGSGNFLYVTLELLKRLEGEVLNFLHDHSTQGKLEMEGVMVTPANFYGIELNPRAAAIAEQVLWIGFLQWHLRTHGHLNNLPEPIIRDLHNVENRDAVLDYDGRTEERDERGKVVTRWDGRTTKSHPVTGEEVPDPEATVPVYTYARPRPAKWPTVDYIVGNPPFLGSKRMREVLGDGYVDALQAAWPEIPQSTDFVMRWWHHCAELVRSGKVRAFGLITTNSLRQAYVRRAVEPHLEAQKPLHFIFAVPDHPWVDSSDGAAVRIAMTVCAKGKGKGRLVTVVSEADAGSQSNDDLVEKIEVSEGTINADLTIGSDVTSAQELRANGNVCSVGMKTIGAGFQVDEETAKTLGRGRVVDADLHIRPYVNGRDISQTRRGVFVVDFYGIGLKDAQRRFPEAYQHLLTKVKPERDQNRNAIFRRDWWIIGHPREQFRKAVKGLQRYIATLETAKHRFFVFLPKEDVPDSSLVTFAFDDSYILGVLSSRIHVTWALATGGRLGVGNDPRYNKTRCFETFPFPVSTAAQQSRIRDIAEELDAHRKQRQALYPELTLTGMYNVQETVRAGKQLTAKDRTVYDAGLVGILKELHDQLDTAVAEAYGWPADLNTDDILHRLVKLNSERATEEAAGLVRWLRPDYQTKSSAKEQGTQAAMEVDEGEPITAAEPIEWPGELPAQAAALGNVLATFTEPATVETIAARFEGKRTKKRLDDMTRLLETLGALGRAVQLKGARWQATR